MHNFQRMFQNITKIAKYKTIIKIVVLHHPLPIAYSKWYLLIDEIHPFSQSYIIGFENTIVPSIAQLSRPWFALHELSTTLMSSWLTNEMNMQVHIAKQKTTS